MSTTRTCAAFALAAVIGTASFASGAAAQANCEVYAKLALQQQQDNVRLKCGFSGPEWTSDLAAHKAWCGTVGPDQWKAQLQKRSQALTGCGKK